MARLTLHVLLLCVIIAPITTTMGIAIARNVPAQFTTIDIEKMVLEREANDDNTDDDEAAKSRTSAIRVCRTTIDLRGLNNPTTSYLAFFFTADGTPYILEGDFLMVDNVGLGNCLSNSVPPTLLAELQSQAPNTCPSPGSFVPNCNFDTSPCTCKFISVDELSTFCLPPTELVTPVTDLFKIDGGICTPFLSP